MATAHDTLDRWADAYVEAQLQPQLDDDHPLWWAVDRFVDSPPEERWNVILLILAKNPPAEVADLLAAGPLEDLIASHGDRFIERIETESRLDPAFRDLLAGVWQHGAPAEIWSRVEVARSGATR